MSHSRVFGDTVFIYNSDLSGDVMIHRASWPEGEHIEVPGSDLLQFVASWVQDRRINAVEWMEWPELLGIEEKS